MEISEIIFIINESEEGGFQAKCLNEPIFTEGESFDELKKNIKEAVLCHFDDGKAPKIVRLHYVKDEVLSL